MSGTARALLDLVRSRPATLGTGRLVCIDGPAASGKTSLGAAVATLEPRAEVVHMDDLYDGWDGLPHVADQLGTILRPLAEGRAGHYRRYDWTAGTWAETVAVEPTPLLVVEGVGSGARAYAHLVTALVWVEAPDDLRLRRGIARDGEALRSRWEQWMADERSHFRRELTRERADLVVDGAHGGATAH